MKKLKFDKGKGLSINIIGKEFHGYDNKDKPIYKNKVLGCLSFMDKKDVVRFGLHVAKNLGIGPVEYAKLANEVINEMGDWK